MAKGRGEGTSLLPRPSAIPRRKVAVPPGWPPGGHGGSGDWNGGNGWDFEGDGSEEPGRMRGLHAVGFGLLMLSITTLFLVFLAASLYLRVSASTWPPSDSPGAPRGLWISTMVLMASSAFLARASSARAQGRNRLRRRWLLVTTAFGICFLALQAYFWRDLLLDRLAGPSTAYGTIFFSLTGLHAVHVLGGVSYLLLETVRASQHGDEKAAAGIDFCAIYWHFMGLLWLTLFALLCYLG